MAKVTSNGIVFHTHRLNNGLRIVGQCMPEFESVAVSYKVCTGSRDEFDPDMAGISHFLEHMIGRATKSLDSRKRIIHEFAKIGAEMNAFTTHESTEYYARTLGEYLEPLIKLLSDMMYPRLAENDFETEKMIIINEIANTEEEPYNRVTQSAFQAYYGSHPLGHSVLGTRESIRNMRIEQMRSFWKKQYVANNMILAVAGNFDWEHLIRLAIQYCSNWRTSEIRRNTEYYEPPSSINKFIVDKKLGGQIFSILMPSVALGDPNFYAAVLGGMILGDGENSRLYNNIYWNGLAESAEAGIVAFKGTGMMRIQATTAPENASHVLRLLRDELDRLLNEGIDENELQRAKNKWISNMVLSNESTFSRMRTIASDWEIEGCLLGVDEEIQRIEKVMIGDVIHVLRHFPTREKQVLTTLGPLSEDEFLG